MKTVTGSCRRVGRLSTRSSSKRYVAATSRSSRLSRFVALVIAALVLTACGGGSGSDSSAESSAVDSTADSDVVTTIEEVPEDELLFDPAAEQEAREAAAAKADSAQEAAIAAVASDEAAEIDGVFVVPVGDVAHVEGEVDYPTSPGVGGDHAAGWQNCGFYTVPVIEEQAVHSLEHGAVWITYNDSTTDIDKLVLETIALKEDHTLVSPYANQESPLVLSAWGRQLSLDSLDDPLFEQFLDMYRGIGPTTPEPGASCSGAFGIPPTDVTTISSSE